jgi:cardiolipin synthase A/B
MTATVLIVTFTVLATALAAILLANLLMFRRNIAYRMADLPGLDDERFLRSLAHMPGVHLDRGNRIELLQNGDQAFAAMIDAVRQAKHTVTFENYIYWSGHIGSQFARLLAEKAQQGVRVHVLVDWVGAFKMSRASLKLMRRAGAEVHRYHRPQKHSLHKFNQRTHRRELVVDGQIGFTGGVGFGDEWLGDGCSNGSWRDNHYRIQGPLVAEMQSIFLDNWLTSSGEVLHGDGYFPALEPSGGHLAGLIRSRPRERITAARLTVLMLLHAARHSVCMSQAYFVPDRSLLKALTRAARRGVRVEVILPGHCIDYRIVRWASRARWGPLLEAGVRLYEYQPSMLHTKLLVIDQRWVLTGSANMDYRSLFRNDEILLAVCDEPFACEHLEVFERDRAKSAEVTYERWKKRPWREKLLDRTLSLIRSQL